jgi:cholest-4-en-3-one 26-monooxygenase
VDLARACFECIDPEHYRRHGYPHEAWAFLRAHAPVARVEHPEFAPFHAITKHADVVALSKQPLRFLNAPRMAMFPSSFYQPDSFPLRHLLNMDPPEHRAYRSLVSARFTPRALEGKRPAVEAIVEGLVDRVAGREVVEFVTEVAAVMPIAVIAEMLGIPAEDRDKFFHWSNQIIAPEDPEYSEGKDARAASDAAIAAQSSYFVRMIEERRERPRDDLVGILANARIGGEPIPEFELLSYLVLLIVAGNETTRNAASGGLLALVQNPDQFEKLRSNPALVRPAVEEIVRWTTPVVQFCRSGDEPLALRGQRIEAGEPMCLFYPSANRDEEVFDQPFAFRVDRWPNPHLGFGIGEHVCLGAHLARLELQAIFGALARRCERVELDGEVERQRSSFVGGVKRIPVRMKLA